MSTFTERQPWANRGTPRTMASAVEPAMDEGRRPQSSSGGGSPSSMRGLWEVEGAWEGTGRRSSGPRRRSRAPPSSRAARAAERPQAGIPRERGKWRWGTSHCYMEAGSRKPTADDVSQESTLKIGNARPSSSAFSFHAVWEPLVQRWGLEQACRRHFEVHRGKRMTFCETFWLPYHRQ